jgi:exopolysaccharide biosynthesis protein
MVGSTTSIPNQWDVLTALADFMKTLGVEKAMNLDGGSSSSFYYDGKTFYGKVDDAGESAKATCFVCSTR